MSTSPSPILGGAPGNDPTQDVQAPAAPIPQADPAVLQSAATGGVAQAVPAPKPTSRLHAIIQAVAQVGSTALAGIPDTGRPSFVTGLGEGERSAQAFEANQQAIKFKNFDDQFRLAQLHNQDLKLQNDTQAQTDAHRKAELDNRAFADSLGIKYDSVPSTAQAVVDHLTAQTAANGAASVPPGTHLSGDGETINIPQNTQATQDGQKQMYQMLAPAFGLPSLSPNADFVPPQLMNMLTNKIHGYGQDGKPIQHEQLPGVIASEQAFRDQFSKNGGSPAQLNALDNRIAVLKANSNAMDKHAASVLDTSEAIKAKYAEQKQDNAASNKPQKPAQVVLALNPNGGSDVLNSDDAAQQGLKVTTPLKAGDVQKLNGTVAGFNDVQTKINKLADIVNSGDFASVQPGIAQAMIEKGLSVDSHGVSIPFGRINAALNAENAKVANPATRKFVVAWLGTHEAVTQLPRLQTFGTSNRMTEKQMEAAQQMLPQAGDDPSLAQEKLSQFQDVLDPLRKQVPRMPGAALLPSFRERQTNQQAPSKGGSNLGRTVLGGGNVNDYINSFVPSN